jgi:hypothetical protein
LAGARYFSLFLSVQTSSEAHPASYPMGTGGIFLPGQSVKLIIHLYLSRMVEIYLTLPYVSMPWCSIN